jgi:hypothetical protein
MRPFVRFRPALAASGLFAATLVFGLVSVAHADDQADPPRDVAVAYLKALAGEGDQAARGHLLGGVPLAAKTYKIPNWNIVEREPLRREQASIPKVRRRVNRIDARGRKALTEVMRVKSIKANEIDRARARELLRLTREEASGFEKDFPVFAYVARVGKDVFWHPKNPWRQVMKDLGKKGSYTLEMHLFRIEEREADRPPRVWPLRVLRITTDQGYDSGWKVLPASNWDPEY